MLDITKVRAITLDLDDTLWPIWPVIARAELALSDWLASQAPRTAALFTDPQQRQSLRQQVLLARPEISHDLRTLRREVIHLGLQQCQEDTTLVDPAYEVFIAERMRVDLFEDARPALCWLAARYPLVAVSNGNADIHRIGLGEFFQAHLSAQSFGVGKPDRRIFHAAAQAAGVQAHEVLHVGDDAALDVLGSLEAGMQAAWVNRAGEDWPHAPERPHLTVCDMAGLCLALQG